MFFIVFVLFFFFFCNILQVNAVKCMTNEKHDLFTIFDKDKCGFDLGFKDEMLTDAQIEGLAHCKSHEANTDLFVLIEGSCYGEVTIDYTNETRSFYFTHVPAAKTLLDPYDDMFGFSQTAESLVQYKIDGNLEKNTFQMTARVQCRASDNCATEKIRSLLKNLTLSDPRKTIFQDLRNLLLGPAATPPTSLSCMKKNNEEETCSTDNDRCQFDISKSDPKMFCTKADPNQLFDIEYRMNIIEKMREVEIRENQREAFKCFYICRTDLCNSLENFAKVDNFLYALAMGSATKAQEPPKTNPTAHYRKPSSTIPIFHTSFNERLMIIFFILIRF